MPPPTFSAASGEERKELVAMAQKATDILKGISHEGRLLILCLLADGEKSISEIEECTAIQQATISQQLAWLRRDGIVLAREDGHSTFYSIASKDVIQLIRMIQSL